MLEKEKQTHFWLRIRHQVLDETPPMHSSEAGGTANLLHHGGRIQDHPRKGRTPKNTFAREPIA